MRRYNRVKVTVEDRTTFVADVVIIAVPLGVLKAKSIKFEPRFPDWKEAAIDDLGAGIESKIAFYDAEGKPHDLYERLRIPVDNLFFAEEATSMSYPGSIHGAFSTGQMAAEDYRMRILGRYGELDLSQPVMGKEASLSVPLLISTHITALASFTKIP
ncbi:hypothetical protein REPUB_Repub10bG0104300 [Reevesia pubescens]